MEDLPWNGYIEDEPQAFADLAVKLYTNKTTWQTCQSQGMDILQQCYSSTQFMQPLIDRILSVQEQLVAHRQQNFQGAMLKHHMLKSTKYMSLWIEEKNKRKE